LRRLFLDPDPPLVAVEVRPRSIGVVRAVPEKGALAVAAASSLELAAGALRPALVGDNVADPTAFRATLRSACERAGVAVGARVALVLPDAVGRILALPAAELAGRGADAAELLRFRLRKTVPFDVRESRVALRREADQVLAVAASCAVLDPYEAACRDCGLEPGRVELAGVVLLDAVVASRPPGDRLVVNWDHGYASLLLARNGAPILARTVTGPGAESAAALEGELASTVRYYREKLGGQGLAGVSLRSAAFDVAEACRGLGPALGVGIEAVEAWGKDDPRLPRQALAGAAASLFRRVA
jgi:type IV pilus assembly protein PilM